MCVCVVRCSRTSGRLIVVVLFTRVLFYCNNFWNTFFDIGRPCRTRNRMTNDDNYYIIWTVATRRKKKGLVAFTIFVFFFFFWIYIFVTTWPNWNPCWEISVTAKAENSLDVLLKCYEENDFFFFILNVNVNFIYDGAKVIFGLNKCEYVSLWK